MNLNPKLANILFVVLIIVVFAFIVFATSYMIKYKDAYTKNPLQYGAEKLDLGECSCSCFNNRKPIYINFNSTSMEYDNQMYGEPILPSIK